MCILEFLKNYACRIVAEFIFFLIILLSVFSEKYANSKELHETERINKFVLFNETNGTYALKAYKDSTWSICNGITYYLFDSKMKEKNEKQNSGHNCRWLQHIKKWRCEVEPYDIVLLQTCQEQERVHYNYHNNILKSKMKHYKLLNIKQKAVLIDILHNHGETNKKVKSVISSVDKFLIKKEKPITLIKKMYNLVSTKNMKYADGIKNRIDRRVNKFFEICSNV